MKDYYNYSCDGGAIAVGNKDFICHFMNDFGDGTHRVYIITEDKKKDKVFNYIDYNTYRFVGSVSGTFNVYNYDCIKEKDRESTEFIIKKLIGRYGVYAIKGSGHMILEYWDEG